MLVVALFSVPVYHTTSLPYTPPVIVYQEVIEEEEKITTIDIPTDVLCNCYLAAETISGIDLPPMLSLKPNITEPLIGDIAIMQYGDIKHVAVITEVTNTNISIIESNYKHCQKTNRTIEYTYNRLVGFYRPG